MTTCFLRYEIDPTKIEEFEHYGRVWITLVEKFGGKHHGYLLPSEGANDVAYASFSFESLAAYEMYRTKAASDEDCLKIMKYAETTQCIRRYERSFMRPVMDGKSL